MAKPKHGGNRFIVASRLVPSEVITAIGPIVEKALQAFKEGKLALVIRLLHYTDEFPYAGEFTKASRAATCRACGGQVDKKSDVFVLYYDFRGFNNIHNDVHSNETRCYIHYECVIPGHKKPETDIAIA